MYRLAADAVLVCHLLFILFIVFGGLPALRRPRIVFAHAPTVLYGAAIEFIGWTCPLTPLENHLRELAGQDGYAGGFVEHHLLPIIYPSALTPRVQVVLGTIVVVWNVCVYALVWRCWRSGA